VCMDNQIMSMEWMQLETALWAPVKRGRVSFMGPPLLLPKKKKKSWLKKR
jgi:hypothetical protein